MASTPIACPRETTDKRRTTTTNNSSSHHHDSAPSRPHSLICTGAEPIHPVHASSQLGRAAVAPRNEFIFLPFWRVSHLRTKLENDACCPPLYSQNKHTKLSPNLNPFSRRVSRTHMVTPSLKIKYGRSPFSPKIRNGRSPFSSRIFKTGMDGRVCKTGTGTTVLKVLVHSSDCL